MEIKGTLGVSQKALEGREKTNGVSSDAAPPDRPAESESQAATADRVEISGRSREMAKANEVLSSTPEVREAKVAEIKERIDNDEYEVDSEKVAHKMIVEFLEEII
ncbi:MAG: flagellar biosynthesis anti-sigma factor FlgM [Desulfarculaceae bacterium]|jgi:negative regulator of flagellin synthesis FlgM